MKKLTSFILCLLIAPTLLAGGFEGKIRLSLKDARRDQPTIIDYSIKEGFLRMDIAINDGRAAGKTITSITDFNKHEIDTLMPDQKMYMVMKLDNIAAAAKNTSSDAQIEKTGETETILGYKTTKYIVKDSKRGTTADVWAAEGIGTFLMGKGGNPFAKNSGPSPLERELAARGFFPLRMINHDASGAETFRMEAVSIEKKSLPDDTFTVPSDYKRFDMGGAFGGFNPFAGKPPQN